MRRLLAGSAALLLCSTLHGQTKRPLAIEDYYRVLTITNPQISPDGKTVRFSVQTRIEADNSTRTEIFTVPTDGSAPPTKVVMPTEGAGEGRGGRGTFPGAPGQAGRRGAIVRVTSPDGTWVARTQEKPQPKTDVKYASDFEKRHQERFKGAIFDWKDFQRDGAPFPVPKKTKSSSGS